ncbi:MAG: histidine kinase dimerization/phospho-acceptor domain-containing protein [Desulfobacteraceae bacterium]|jgi:C4-dicarboxylate-specific signal transduction histidine kinase|nr:histidine kinase dimerization/phospho-acceptor domain-containing protein [Desulfobacteraceae bacterium]
MTDDSQAMAAEGVRFFGEISASISHEIKNVLAIINESAGLLQDLVMMIEKGMPPPTERLSGLAQSMVRQVKRGDRIVKDMNRFAHSADHPSESVEVGEVIHFICGLAARLIVMKGDPPKVEVPATPIAVVTNRFFLEDLVWRCLCRAMDACAPDQMVCIVAEKAGNAPRIRFCGLAGDFLAREGGLPSPREAMVAGLLGVHLKADSDKGEIAIIFPS